MDKIPQIPFSLYFCTFLIFVYALQLFTGFDPGFQAYESHPVNFFLSFFGHSDAEHLFNNIFFLGLFGTVFELITSRKTFIYTFLASAIFANITAFIFYTDSYIIGASGGAMGVLSALAVYRPRKIGLALGIPVPMYIVLAVYVMINLAGIGSGTGTAYEAHLFGLLTGSLIGIWMKDFEFDEEDGSEEKLGEDNWDEKIRRWEEKYML
ncbi:rhomboid family intramembrane serine protease [Candidatus Nanosalina sp. VS9-1]|uniref:rhomboid family intramembrane serine protease n=1 Tax=Candidatus Nanosalina sp. VS9-1 TaxID=3388566 RepID=UPI0039E0097C